MSLPANADIAVLTRAMKRCDESAWRQFHERYYELLSRVVLARGIDDAEVPDLIQRTYLRVLKHLKAFTTEADFRAWVCCLLRSEIIDTARKAQRRSSMLERFRGWLRPSADFPERSDLLEGMEPGEKSLLERHYIEGWSQADLAAEEGVSTKAIESKLARLRLRARAFLESQDALEP